jgi:MinD-like ATPase involved in chromosome partitioning or flagellar assembly
MTGKKIHFNDALKETTDLLRGETFPDSVEPLIIRDIYGRIRVALKNGKKEKHRDIASRLGGKLATLAPFCGEGENGVLFPDDFFDPEAVFNNPDILDFLLPDSDKQLRLLDRQVVGQDWLRPVSAPPQSHRIVFFGLKGGVGRSTAMSMAAYHLARSGKRVLLIDFDLESPGLSGLLLPPERLTDFGMVDWFIEDAVGQGETILNNMISVSPLSEHTQGEIRVAAAMGLNESFYLAKLSRVFADVSLQNRVERFSQRANRLVAALEAHEEPDVVLIDSRAGLHDLAAVSIVGLATVALLFAVDSAQTWQGYRLLFSQWQCYPSILKTLRDRLVMVEALFPETDQAARAGLFLENAYKLFSETIYEQIEPGQDPDPDVFNFDMNDTSAPHYPLLIKWNNRFQEFNPLMLPKGLLTDTDIAATFGDFLDGFNRLIEGGKA